VERRLAAVLIADVVGYSRLLEEDEAGTLAALAQQRASILEPTVSAHAGRIVKLMGDGVLIEFGSAVNAVAGALELQRRMAETNAPLPKARQIILRIGINLGDVIGEGADIYGEGVNIAARLEELAEPGGTCISAKVHEEVHGKLSCTVEDMGEQTVKNFVRPVRVYRLRPDKMIDGASPGRPVLSLPDKPSIAVLPFENMSGDSEQEYFADGIVEDITTALSRLRWLFVIARNSSFTYKGRAVDVKQVGRELGVRYVLEGSVRKAGKRVRITGQLIDASTGAHLWADRFDGELADVFDLQDQVTASVVGAIAPKLEQAEIERAKRKPTESLDAYDYFLRGMWSGHRLDQQAVLAAGVLEPRPQVVSEGASDVDVEAGTSLRAVVHEVDQDRRLGEQALGAAAGRKCTRVQIQRAALGEHIARARAGDPEGGPAIREVGDRAVDVGKRERCQAG
jgi:TolB-like protein/class 3 adenylate cyclase